MSDLKDIFVVEAISLSDGERNVAGVFSTREKMVDYVEASLNDKEMERAIGKYEYIMSCHKLDMFEEV